MENDTLYYDGACPLCWAEVGKLKKFTKEKLVLKNIHELEAEEAVPSKELLLSRLHLKTADGQWLTGLTANIRAWHHTPFRYLWRMLDWPLIRIFSHWAYEFWLRRRNQSGTQCATD
jgi:predicted DCC family thiol-disulfide oxidoreductase YuxK